jgi:hypothetical protein
MRSLAPTNLVPIAALPEPTRLCANDAGAEDDELDVEALASRGIAGLDAKGEAEDDDALGSRWCVDLGREIRPMSTRELWTALARGTVGGDVPVWREGRERWEPASRVHELACSQRALWGRSGSSEGRSSDDRWSTIDEAAFVGPPSALGGVGEREGEHATPLTPATNAATPPRCDDLAAPRASLPPIRIELAEPLPRTQRSGATTPSAGVEPHARRVPAPVPVVAAPPRRLGANTIALGGVVSFAALVVLIAWAIRRPSPQDAGVRRDGVASRPAEAPPTDVRSASEVPRHEAGGPRSPSTARALSTGQKGRSISPTTLGQRRQRAASR